jgi:hypothetical protein
MSTDLAALRAADPAADLNVAPDQRLLAEILTQPQRRRVPSRRLVVGGTLVAALVAAVLTVPLAWNRFTAANAAWSITNTGSDSIEVSITWSQVHDPEQLQEDLDRAGTHVKFYVTGRAPAGALPKCATFPNPTAGDVSRAVTQTVGGGDDGHAQFVVHPDRFPPNAYFVVVVNYLRPDDHHAPTIEYFADGPLPTDCAPLSPPLPPGASTPPPGH